MKIVKIKAGLGNQMFQYAFSKYLETQYGCDVYLDFSYFDSPSISKYLEEGIKQFDLEFKIADKAILKKHNIPYNNHLPHHFLHRLTVALQIIFNGNKYFFEKNRQYINIDGVLNHLYFDGYWQSWRYLNPIKDCLFESFKPKKELSKITQVSIENVKKTNSVFIGIRKGDYSNNSKSIKHYGLPSFDYYKDAVDIIKQRIQTPFFYVFSDDIEWVKQNIDFQKMGIDKKHVLYRDKTNVYNDFEELFVMSSCKHAIISNSTFNFWGAWLIQNKDKIVIAPKQWFKDNSPIDIIPPEWIKI